MTFFSRVLIAACLALPLAQASDDWETYSRQLFSENREEVASAATRLKAMPNLKAQLEGALTMKSWRRALDVSARLGLREMIEPILRIADGDRDGWAYSTVNQLANKADWPALTKRYLATLEQKRATLSVPIKSALLQGLLMADTPPSPALCEALMSETSSDLRLQTVRLARAGLVDKHDERYRGVLKIAQQNTNKKIASLATLTLSAHPAK